MKGMKCSVYVLLFIMTFLLSAGTVKAETARIYTTEANLDEGEVSIPVHIDNNPGLMGFVFNLLYDSSVIDVIDIKQGDIIQSGIFDYNNDMAGKTKVLWSNTSESEGNGVIFYIIISFKEKLTEATDIELTYQSDDTFDGKYNNVALECDDIVLSPNTDNIITISSATDTSDALPKNSTADTDDNGVADSKNSSEQSIIKKNTDINDTDSDNNELKDNSEAEKKETYKENMQNKKNIELNNTEDNLQIEESKVSEKTEDNNSESEAVRTEDNANNTDKIIEENTGNYIIYIVVISIVLIIVFLLVMNKKRRGKLEKKE